MKPLKSDSGQLPWSIVKWRGVGWHQHGVACIWSFKKKIVYMAGYTDGSWGLASFGPPEAQSVLGGRRLVLSGEGRQSRHQWGAQASLSTGRPNEPLASPPWPLGLGRLFSGTMQELRRVHDDIWPAEGLFSTRPHFPSIPFASVNCGDETLRPSVSEANRTLD